MRIREIYAGILLAAVVAGFGFLVVTTGTDAVPVGLVWFASAMMVTAGSLLGVDVALRLFGGWRNGAGGSSNGGNGARAGGRGGVDSSDRSQRRNQDSETHRFSWA
jgi:hypothetical protein